MRSVRPALARLQWPVNAAPAGWPHEYSTLLRCDQNQPGMLGFDRLQQALLIHRLQLREHQQAQIFALREAGEMRARLE